jgi:hypothetical protein
VSPLIPAAFVLTLWEALGRRLPDWSGFRAPQVTPRAAALAALLLVSGFAQSLFLLAYQSGHDGLRPGWIEAAPFRFVDDAYPFGPEHGLISLAALGLAVMQTVGFGSLVLGVAQRESMSRRLVPFVAGILAILAIWSPAVSSGDVFGYVGLGMLGSHVFERPAHFFTGEYAALFDGYPLRPTIYGPLWVALNAAVVALGGTFAAKVLALRAFGAVLLGALAWLVMRLTRSRAMVAAVLLNPMLWLQFVANAHNDVLAVTLIVAALVLLAQRRPAWAMALVGAAGLVKLPFLVVGAVAFGRLGTRRAFLYAAGACALCLALSALFGGRPYFDALLATARGRGAFMDPVMQAAKAALALAALGSTLFVLLRGRYPSFAGWLYPALAPVLFPWYLIWAVPYALAAEAGALTTLLVLPVLGTLCDTIYGLDAFALALPVAALAALVVAMRANPGGLSSARSA